MSLGASFAVSRLNCWKCHFIGHVWETSKVQNVTPGKHLEDRASDSSPASSALSSIHCLGSRCCLHSVGPEQSGNGILALIYLSTCFPPRVEVFDLTVSRSGHRETKSRLSSEGFSTWRFNSFTLLGKHCLVGSAIPNLLFILLMGLVQWVPLIVLVP